MGLNEDRRKSDGLSTTVAEHGTAIKNIVGLIKSLSEDVNTLSDRIIAGTKTPVSTILTSVSIVIIITLALGSYMQRELNRQETEIISLREAQYQALYEAGRNEATRDRIDSIELWQESHDLRVRGLNSRQDETLRWLEKLDDEKLR